MADLPKCSVLHKREVTIPNCKDEEEYCKRTYHLSLPGILCNDGNKHRRLEDEIHRGPINDYEDKFFSGQYRKVGTIPLVFAFHGLGTDYRTMADYADSADEHNFVLILPEGINQSFNAGDCCGDAHELEIHDVDFIFHIQDLLNQEFDFVQREYSYGIGWDNGGLLLTDAAIESPHLFKAIVPIAGYSTRTWTPPSIGTGIGIMMHHSLDDLIMRPSGCCDDPNMPVCEGEIVSESCDSVLDSFDLWARTVNLCKIPVDKNAPKGMSTLLAGGGNGSFYTLEQEDGITSLHFLTVGGERDVGPAAELSFSELPMSVTYTRDNVTCLTTATTGCVANSTLCLYSEVGHFEDIVSTPFMGDQVMDFLARDACGTKVGSWKAMPGADEMTDRMVCACSGSGHEGVFCLDAVVETSLLMETSVRNVVPPSVFGAAGLFLLVFFALLLTFRRAGPKDGRDFQRPIGHFQPAVGTRKVTLPRLDSDPVLRDTPQSEPGTSGKGSLLPGHQWVKTKFENSRSRVRKLGGSFQKSAGASTEEQLTTLDVDDNKSDCSEGSVSSQKSLERHDLQLMTLYE